MVVCISIYETFLKKDKFQGHSTKMTNIEPENAKVFQILIVFQIKFYMMVNTRITCLQIKIFVGKSQHHRTDFHPGFTEEYDV